MAEVQEYNFTFGVGEESTNTTTSMKNIQLETLEKVILDIKTKRVFLYTDDPNAEPEYLTIQDIINTINEDFDLINTIETLQTLIDGLSANDQRISTLEGDVNNIKTAVDSLNTDNENNNSHIQSLLDSVSSILGRLSNVEILAEANKNNIVTLQGDVINMQNQMSNMANVLNQNSSTQNISFELLSWKNL